MILLDRLFYILESRDRYPWGLSIGLTRGTINRIFKEGQTPGSEALSVICRTENASISWLLEGRGAPFIVALTLNDADSAELINIHLTDEPGNWAIYVIDNAEGEHCVVLRQPGQIVQKDELIHFNILEIIANVGPLSLQRIAQASEDKFSLRLADDDFKKLTTGYMGSYALCGWRNEPGLLSQAVPLADLHLWCVAEDAPAYGEDRLINKYRHLGEDNQRRILSIVDALDNEAMSATKREINKYLDAHGLVLDSASIDELAQIIHQQQHGNLVTESVIETALKLPI